MGHHLAGTILKSQLPIVVKTYPMKSPRILEGESAKVTPEHVTISKHVSFQDDSANKPHINYIKYAR